MNQLEALWAVGFRTATGQFGAGVLVFETGRIFGGDSSYYYLGTYQTKDDTITATVTATHYFGAKNNVFGAVDKVTIEFSGKIVGAGTLTAGGTVVGAPHLKMEVKGQRLAPLP